MARFIAHSDTVEGVRDLQRPVKGKDPMNTDGHAPLHVIHGQALRPMGIFEKFLMTKKIERGFLEVFFVGE